MTALRPIPTPEIVTQTQHRKDRRDEAYRLFFGACTGSLSQRRLARDEIVLDLIAEAHAAAKREIAELDAMGEAEAPAREVLKEGAGA